MPRAAEIIFIHSNVSTLEPAGVTRRQFEFDLPAGIDPSLRAYLLYQFDPGSALGGLKWKVEINNTRVGREQLAGAAFRTLGVTVPPDVLRPGLNGIAFEVEANPNSDPVSISDVALWCHKDL